jgi:hypothetical protein
MLHIEQSIEQRLVRGIDRQSLLRLAAEELTLEPVELLGEALNLGFELRDASCIGAGAKVRAHGRGLYATRDRGSILCVLITLETTYRARVDTFDDEFQIREVECRFTLIRPTHLESSLLQTRWLAHTQKPPRSK